MSDKSSQLATLSTAIQTGIDNRLKDLHTAMPGIIQTFDPDTQLATVQPAIRRIFKSTDDESIETLTPTDISILINVPVVYPGGGGFHLTFPVKKGDECLLVFCERSYDRWYNFSGVQNPGAKRFHALSDATAFVGITSRPNAIPSYDSDNVQLKKDDGSVAITLKANNDLDLHSDANITADCVNATVVTSGSATITAGADIIAGCVNATVTATGAATITAVSSTVTASATATITAPIINLNGIVNLNGIINTTGILNANAGLNVTGAVINNTKNIGDTHGHTQNNDGNGDVEQPIIGVT
jgi:hypothetical protein